MQIDVIAMIGEARSDDMVHKTVIVIDVLRATSTMITALARGCSDIVPVETVLRAKELQRDGDLLGGERFCKKIPGFDLGNSPLEYLDADIAGKRIIMTTTNGTRGIQKACKAEHILAGSLLNGRACAGAAFDFRRDIVIVCAGTQDVFSLEDGLCAGQIIEELKMLHGEKSFNVNDFGIAMHNSFLHVQSNLTEALFHCWNGNRLNKLGFGSDIRYCSQINVSEIVPIMDRGAMVIHKKAAH
jgi:2-phosphosulfolactate phosphatase